MLVITSLLNVVTIPSSKHTSVTKNGVSFFDLIITPIAELIMMASSAPSLLTSRVTVRHRDLNTYPRIVDHYPHRITAFKRQGSPPDPAWSLYDVWP